MDFADPTMVPDPSFRNPPNIQRRDITPTSKVGELLNYIPDPAAAFQDTFASLASSLSGDNKAASASESEQGIAEFVEAEKLRPTTPATKPTTKPNPDLPAGGGAKSALSGKLGGMEGQLADYLAQMDKVRDQDKWLALANTGLALMASKQPTLGGALGEAGMAGMKQLQDGKKQYSKDKMAILALQQRIDAAKLAAQTSLDVANIRAAAVGKGGSSGTKLPTGSSLMTYLSGKLEDLTGQRFIAAQQKDGAELMRIDAEIAEVERQIKQVVSTGTFTAGTQNNSNDGVVADFDVANQ